MPQRQRHRGPHPEDARLFAPKWHAVLRAAVADLSYLLSRDYAAQGALKMVGDHYQLHARQRQALLRTACSDASLRRRGACRAPTETLRGAVVDIDGYNLLITIESALGGGVLLRGRDGCVRDLASMHGSYRKVEETVAAIGVIGEGLSALGVARACWRLDAPVSNSGRLKALLRHEADAKGWCWEVELANGVDKLLSESKDIVITSDGWILDRAARWANAIDPMLAAVGATTRVLDLGDMVR